MSREVTIQVRPAQGRDIEAEVARAAEIARAYPGIAEVRPYSKEESARLLEPWLGGGLALARSAGAANDRRAAAPTAAPTSRRCAKLLAERVAGASLDDHRAWIDRMRTMARTTIAAESACCC